MRRPARLPIAHLAAVAAAFALVGCKAGGLLASPDDGAGSLHGRYAPGSALGAGGFPAGSSLQVPYDALNQVAALSQVAAMDAGNAATLNQVTALNQTAPYRIAALQPYSAPQPRPFVLTDGTTLTSTYAGAQLDTVSSVRQIQGTEAHVAADQTLLEQVSASWWFRPDGTYKLSEAVATSSLRELGTYVTEAAATTSLVGQSATLSIMFTPAGGGATATTTNVATKTAISGGFQVKSAWQGILPGGLPFTEIKQQTVLPAGNSLLSGTVTVNLPDGKEIDLAGSITATQLATSSALTWGFPKAITPDSAAHLTLKAANGTILLRMNMDVLVPDFAFSRIGTSGPVLDTLGNPIGRFTGYLHTDSGTWPLVLTDEQGATRSLSLDGLAWAIMK